MSPISEKFLKSRLGLGEAPGSKIENDRPCPNCGYNLRGLTYGRNCPECGEAIRRALESGPADDIVGTGDPLVRRRLQMGFGLAAACLGVAVVARWGSLFIGAFVLGRISPAYSWCVAVNGLAWVAAVWMITPRALDHHWPRLAPLRWVVRLTQFGWPIGLALLAHARHDNVGPMVQADLMKWDAIFRFGAGIGALMLLALLHTISRGAELETAAKRFYLAGWFVPITSVLPWSYPSSFPWVFIYLLILLLAAWTWAMWQMFAGLWELQSHAGWSLRAVHEAVERESRVAEARAELEREVAARVRPVKRDAGEDVPLN